MAVHTHSCVHVRRQAGTHTHTHTHTHSKNSWNKGKLRNRHRVSWIKGKTGIGLDEHRVTHHEARQV